MGQISRALSFRGWFGMRLIALAAALVCNAAEFADDLEYRVKAAFLLNFAKFVDWPADSSAAAPPPVVICVIGDDPFGAALDQVVLGESVGSRKLVVQRHSKPVQEQCNIAFFSRRAGEVGRPDAVGPGVLTVGEGEEFLKQGGMIAFVIDNRRVRFDVNQSAARTGSVRLSSRLLNVARTVER